MANTFPENILAIQTNNLQLINSIDFNVYGTTTGTSFTFPSGIDYTSPFYCGLTLSSTKATLAVDSNGTYYWGLGNGPSTIVTRVFFDLFLYGSGTNTIYSTNIPPVLIPFIPKQLQVTANLGENFVFQGASYFVLGEVFNITQNKSGNIALLGQVRFTQNATWTLSFYQ